MKSVESDPSLPNRKYPLHDSVHSLEIAYEKLQDNLQSVNEELLTVQSKLDRSAQFQYALLQKTTDAILFINLEGVIIFANRSAQKLISKPMILKRFWDIFSDDYFGFSLKEALCFGICRNLIYQSFPKEKKEFEISTSFYLEGPKSEHGLIIKAVDLSEKIKTQQLLSRSNRMAKLGEMATQIAHEIKNPLGGIRGYSMLLYRDLTMYPHFQEMIAQIIDAARSLENLVSSVLEFSKPIQISPQMVNLSDLLHQTIKWMKADPASLPTIRYALHIPNESIFVFIDSDAIKRCFLNLIVNALQAIPEGGEIMISLLKNETCCIVSISDTGIGMDEDQLKTLFTPHFTTKKRGNGLGLVEAQKIVEAHFGSIQVRSTLGKGTTFSINLPIKRS